VTRHPGLATALLAAWPGCQVSTVTASSCVIDNRTDTDFNLSLIISHWLLASSQVTTTGNTQLPAIHYGRPDQQHSNYVGRAAVPLLPHSPTAPSLSPISPAWPPYYLPLNIWRYTCYQMISLQLPAGSLRTAQLSQLSHNMSTGMWVLISLPVYPLLNGYPGAWVPVDRPSHQHIDDGMVDVSLRQYG